jgi:hypothetical protein
VTEGTMEATGAEGGAGRRAARPAKAPGFRSADEARAVLDALLGSVDRDEQAGGLLRAAAPRIRIELTDLSLVVNLAPADEPERQLEWRFDDRTSRAPRLRIAMDSGTANAYLQGRESLAIAIARGRVRCDGDARAALLYVPALKLLVEPYRRLLAERFPHLLGD